MRRFKWLMIGALALLLALFGTAAFAQEGDALVRFVHTVPGAAAIDVYVNDELTISGLDFGQATDYLTMPAGAYTVSVTQNGLTTVLWEQEITPTAGTASTLIASSTNPLLFSVYNDSLAPLDIGKARITVIHALDGGPTVDVLIAGNRSVFPDVAYNTPTGSIDLDLSVEYEMGVVPAGEGVENAIVPPAVVPLTSGAVFTYVVYGTANNPALLLLSAPAAARADDGFVRVGHAIPGAPEVDVYFNGVRVISRLPFAATTQYISAPAGDYSVEVRVAGSGAEVANANLTLESGARLTGLAVGTLETPVLAGFADDLGGIDSATAVLQVINALPDSENGSVSLGDNVLVDGLVFLDTQTVSFAASSEAAVVSVTVDGDDAELDLPTAPFYGGVYYTLALIAGEDGPQVLALDPVSIAQTAGSAPGAETLGAVAEAPTEAPTPAPAATEVVTAPEAPSASSEVTGGTAATPTPAPIVSLTGGPTGIVVNLDPTANLRLRQYPNTGSFTLHLLPLGTTVLVNGREGIEEFPEGVPTSTPLPDATPFVDPATFLTSPRADLAPETTWLNVTYPTPDGGTITGWAIALYLNVRDSDGQPQRLADLPLIPRNRPGEALNTAITPPPPPSDRVTVVVTGINPGANLNLRRTPETGGEVLASIPAGTVLDFVGLNEARTWVFVRYLPLEGGTVTGWVAFDFVTFNFNGRTVQLDELEQRRLLTITPDDTRGAVEANVSPVVAPTRDPLRDAIVASVTGINPGANLNLRRTPNVQGEVLAPIPSGTILLVLGRTEDSVWLEVSYEGQVGWVASQYVTLTFNGAAVDINTVPVTSLRLTPTPGA